MKKITYYISWIAIVVLMFVFSITMSGEWRYMELTQWIILMLILIAYVSIIHVLISVKKSNLDFFSLNPKHKRIVAREFIVILICGIILLVGLFVCWAYEKYLKNREEFFLEKDHSVCEMPDEAGVLLTQYKLEQQFLFNAHLYIHFGSSLSVPVNWNNLVEVVEGKKYFEKFYNEWSTNGIIKFLKSEGYETAHKFSAFVKENSLTKKDSFYYAEANKNIQDREKFRDVAKEYRSRIESMDYGEIFHNTLFVILLLFFPFRYLVYMTIWSVKQLKIKK